MTARTRKKRAAQDAAATTARTVLGVDFGTSNCCAAIGSGNGSSEIVRHDEFDEMFPSCVFVGHDDQVYVGYEALAQGLLRPDRFRDKLKIDLLRNQAVWLGGKRYEPEHLVSFILKRVAEQVVAQSGAMPEETVLTVPASFTERENHLVLGAATAVGMRNVRLLPEPVAAARYYAATEQLQLQPGQTALVYDFGGGTFDAALVERTNDGYIIPAPPGGLIDCGGSDIDELLLAELLSGESQTWAIREERGEKNVRLRRELLDICRRVKHGFANPQQQRIETSLPSGLDQAHFAIDRARFHELVSGVVERTIGSCEQVLRTAGRKPGDLAAIIPVGGSSRLTLVTEMLRARFSCPIVVKARPHLVVCMGAALANGHAVADPYPPASSPRRDDRIITRSAPVHEQLAWFTSQLQGVQSAIDRLTASHERFRTGTLKELTDEVREEIAAAGRRLAHPVFRMATISTTSAGKSTVVNALIGHQLAPMSDREMSAGVLRLRDSDTLAMRVKDTAGRQWPLDYRTRGEELSVAGIYSFLRYDVMEKYHRVAAVETVEIPMIDVDAPLLAGRSKDHLQLPDVVTLEICDLPGLNSTRNDDHNLRVIQDQMQNAFCLMAIDYTQTDRVRREMLLDEMVHVVNATGGEPDGIVFVLNKFDARGPADRLEEAKEYLEELRDEIQKRLHLQERPDLLPLNARLWSLAQAAWGNGPLDQPPIATAAAREAALKDIQRYCANDIQAMLETRDFEEWYMPRHAATPRGTLLHLNDEELREFLRFVYRTTGAAALLEEIRRRVRERFTKLVLWPAIVEAVHKAEKFLAKVGEVVANHEGLAAGKLQDVIKDAERRRELVRQSIEEECRKYLEVLDLAATEFEHIEGMEAPRKPSKALVTKLEELGVGGEFYQTMLNLRNGAQSDLATFVIEPLLLESWSIDHAALKRRLEKGLPPQLADELVRCYGEYLAHLAHATRRENHAAVFKRDASDRSTRHRIDLAVQAYSRLVDVLARALSQRAQHFLIERASGIEKSLVGMLGNLHDRLRDVAREHAGIERALPGTDARERPKRFRVRDDLFTMKDVQGPTQLTEYEKRYREVQRRQWYTLWLWKKTEIEEYHVAKAVEVQRLPGPRLIGDDLAKLAGAATNFLGSSLARWALSAFEDYEDDLRKAAAAIFDVVREELEIQQGRSEQEIAAERARWAEVGSRMGAPHEGLAEMRSVCFT